MLRVGLTGGIASGKSTIMRMFAALGCITVDADTIVARLYQPGEVGHQALIQTYGEKILAPDGEIDRKALADIAFSSPDDAKRLNALIHPIVLAEEARMMRLAEERDDDAIYIVEATLLLESGGKQRYDRIIVVDIPPDLQIARGIARGLTEHEVKRRIAHQMPREERLKAADYVIDNSGDERHALKETARVYAALRAEIEDKKRRPGHPPGASSKNR